ncbi:peptidyl-prolyl cis-trans isomerase A (cyclophilin A) [Modicisalibacter muralis]|uniref:Peptidyl-prolyl cis-trans isomerase n=1 Tax=Modicisalibacter muralis TaxID=119000 RepID=A0A1G9PH26_9GAMM|nr:peptidylprolyl isomerase [Halomonas muralis]SDL97517.1 peptidyl-prolyl cis-trans isomerase A (cyclophilin A) [Halomonas muralis]
MNLKTISGCIGALVLALVAVAPALGATTHDKAAGETPTVVLQTSKGDITLELFSERAPITVKNFLAYVDEGFYGGTIFHRVIPGFMIQGGGLTVDMTRKSTKAPIENEADNGLTNQRGTLAMARTQSVNSATAQFFINVADNDFLNHGVRGYGYAVFARVVDGMDVVDSIAEVSTDSLEGRRNVPEQPIVIERVVRKE